MLDWGKGRVRWGCKRCKRWWIGWRKPRGKEMVMEAGQGGWARGGTGTGEGTDGVALKNYV